jgi:hypothetical protein
MAVLLCCELLSLDFEIAFHDLGEMLFLLFVVTDHRQLFSSIASRISPTLTHSAKERFVENLTSMSFILKSQQHL